MTPAILFLNKHKLVHKVHKYQLNSQPDNYGQAVADALGVPHGRLFKTLLVSLNGEPKTLGVCIIPVSSQLNLKAAAKGFGVKKADMSDPAIAEKTTGYVVGGISPFGQKKRLPTLIDQSALSLDTLFASAGKRGLQIEVSPQDLIAALNAQSLAITD